MKSYVFKLILTLAFIMSLSFAGTLLSQPAPIQEEILKSLESRNLGPFRAGSWVTAFAVPEKPMRDHLYTFYVGTRNGGVWKTTNNGTTFEPIFDEQTKLSIGDIAVAPSNPDIVWVGTGESYCARSSHAGNGVYKSEDGGKTWTHLGLEETHHISRLIIHPENPNIVYVASMGHLFSENPERGVFKTEDGGKTWEKIFYLNEKVGVIDLVMCRSNPDILYAASYDKVRLPWHYELGGTGSGIYKTEDAGKTWSKLEGGLPKGRIGRIGIDIYQKNPEILYAVVENGNLRPPTQEEADQDKRRGREPSSLIKGNEVYRSDDGGKSWRKINEGYEQALNKAPYSFNMLKIDPNDPDTVYITGISLAHTYDAGKTWYNMSWPPNGVFQNAFGDVRTIWIDPEDSNRILFGSDGGVYLSYDRGKTCTHLYQIPLGEIYAIGVDMEDPYNIYCGLQDHDSWKGPSNGWSGVVSLSDWVTVGGGDGMYNCIDPTDNRWLFNNQQFGKMWRLDQKLGVQKEITPTRPKDKEPLRFNWTPPIHLSPHDPKVVYVGAQLLLRSPDRGESWEEISPDLTTSDESKKHGEGHISFCTLTTISESPVKKGVIWTGSDDGKVYVTLDGGKSWLDRTGALTKAGAPSDFWVSRVFASPHDEGTAFVTKTGLRFDDFRPFLFKTTDFGETWIPLHKGLPEDKCLNVVVQDHENPHLIFVGTEQGVYITFDGGQSWLPFKNNMPWVKVTDLIIHPRENDLIVGTYGRGLYIVDIFLLQQLTPDFAPEQVHLFSIESRTQRIYGGIGNYRLFGDNHIRTPNEPNGFLIYYYLKNQTSDKVKIKVIDTAGNVIRELEGTNKSGLNRVFWDMRAQKERKPQTWFFRGPLVEPGEYTINLEVSGKIYSRKTLIRGRQGWTVGPVPVEIK